MKALTTTTADYLRRYGMPIATIADKGDSIRSTSYMEALLWLWRNKNIYINYLNIDRQVHQWFFVHNGHVCQSRKTYNDLEDAIVDAVETLVSRDILGKEVER